MMTVTITDLVGLIMILTILVFCISIGIPAFGIYAFFLWFLPWTIADVKIYLFAESRKMKMFRATLKYSLIGHCLLVGVMLFSFICLLGLYTVLHNHEVFT